MMTSPTCVGSTLARVSASLMTIEPSSGAATLASAPPNLPMAVRTAETMTMSSMGVLLAWSVGASGLRADVASRRRLDHLVLRAAVAFGRGDLLAAVLRQPVRPVGPPAARVLLGLLQPLRMGLRQLVVGPVRTLLR